MNDQSMSSASGASLIPDSTSIITGTHFVFMAIFAVLVIIGIIWGVRLKHRRDVADREVAQDNRDIETSDRDPLASDAERAAVAPTNDPGTTPAPQPAPPPAAPPPPPINDGPAIGRPGLADEPIVAAAPLEASPASEAEPAALASADTDIPVTRLKGLGPKVAARLAELGITDAAQLAALSDDEAAALDARLGNFSGRMARDRWIEQARFLATGDTAGFEAVFGKL